MRFDPEDPNLVLDGRYAAAYLGISENTLRRLRRCGLLPAFQIPSSRRGARKVWRYPCSALHEFVKANTSYTRFEHPLIHRELPIKAIADLLGVSIGDVKNQKWRGRLKGYSPASVRNYLLNISRKSLSWEIRRNYNTELSGLRKELRRLRRLLKSMQTNAAEGLRCDELRGD